jgi:hypothetical protein
VWIKFPRKYGFYSIKYDYIAIVIENGRFMLLLEELIIDSDGDMQIGSCIVAGFDDEKNFAVVLDYTDYETGYNRKTWAVVEKEDALAMADYLKVRLTSLPQEILERFGDSSDIAVPSEVEAVFKEILDFIIACGVRYRLKKD